MKLSNLSLKRRAFLTRGAGVLAACAALPWLGSRAVAAEPQVKLTEDDATAQALGYKHDATTVDVEKFPKRAGEEGAKQLCNNCSLYAGEADAEWAPCAIFQNRLVKGAGWCNAWVEKPKA